MKNQETNHGAGVGVNVAVVIDQKQSNQEGADATCTRTPLSKPEPVLQTNNNNNDGRLNAESIPYQTNGKDSDDKSQQVQQRHVPKKRPICTRCQRPTPLACICEGLPESPIYLQHCRVLVLQHPHEERRKNRSLPLIQLCLAADTTAMTVVQGRRFGDQAPHAVEMLQQKSSKVLLIFPEQPVVLDHTTGRPILSKEPPKPPLSLSEARAFCRGADSNTTTQNESETNPSILVVILDATWKYAKEMDKINAELGLYPSHMERVALSWDDPWRPPEATVPCRFDIRTPPSDVHLSTAECLAWVLSALECEAPDPPQQKSSKNEHGSSLYARLMKPLDVMVRKWHDCRANKMDHHKHNHKQDQRRRREKRTRHKQSKQSKDAESDVGKEETRNESEAPPSQQQQEEKKNYDYYANPDHDPAVASQLTEEEALISRTSFFTSGDQERKLHSKKGRGRNRKRGRR